MNTKRITYLAATLALATAAASCEHEEIYEPLEFSVRLAPTNTYRTGDPVVFNFSGNADFITVWTGDTGHEYKHRNRTKVDIADIESCELEIEISQQYGTLNNLVLFAGNKFAGLNGSDAATDRPVVEAIAANDCADWTKLEFTPNNANKFKTYTYDITRFADRFSWGMHLFYPDPKTTMRTYRINPKITVKFKGHDTQVYNYPDMEFVPFSLASQHADDPYIHNVSGNGNLKFQGQPGANNTANIVFQGFSAGAFPEIDQWAFMQPGRAQHDLARHGPEHQGRDRRPAELLVHLHRAGDLHGDLHRRRGQLPGTVGARSLRGDVHGDRPDRITRPKVFASPPFSKKGGLFHNIRLHFCVFSSNFGGET